MLMCRLGQVSTFGFHSCLKEDILAFEAMCFGRLQYQELPLSFIIIFFFQWAAYHLAHFIFVSHEHLLEMVTLLLTGLLFSETLYIKMYSIYILESIDI